MTREFEHATQVRRRGEGRYDAPIAAGWDIGGNANGGYLIALAARAMADAVGRPPLSLTAHYLSPGRPGDAEVDIDVIRSGRRMATAAARLRSEHGDVLALLGTFGEQGVGGASVIDAEPPDLPPIEACLQGGPPAAAGISGMGERVRTSYRPDDVGFRTGEPSGRAEVAGWFEFADGAPIDEFGLMVAVDAFAPVCFNRAEFPVSWAPTLELTIHIRGLPAPGPLRCHFRSRFIQSGMFEEDGTVWDATGTLVAQSRQLALIPRR